MMYKKELNISHRYFQMNENAFDGGVLTLLYMACSPYVLNGTDQALRARAYCSKIDKDALVALLDEVSPQHVTNLRDLLDNIERRWSGFSCYYGRRALVPDETSGESLRDLRLTDYIGTIYSICVQQLHMAINRCTSFDDRFAVFNIPLKLEPSAGEFLEYMKEPLAPSAASVPMSSTTVVTHGCNL